MKKGSILALVILIFALVIAIGSVSFLGPCIHEDGNVGACHWASRMLLGLGALMAVLALLALLLPTLRPGLFVAMIPTALLGILTPGTIISICAMATMRCRMVMRPSMLILFSATLIAAFVGWLLSRREVR